MATSSLHPHILDHDNHQSENKLADVDAFYTPLFSNLDSHPTPLLSPPSHSDSISHLSQLSRSLLGRSSSSLGKPSSPLSPNHHPASPTHLHRSDSNASSASIHKHFDQLSLNTPSHPHHHSDSDSTSTSNLHPSIRTLSIGSNPINNLKLSPTTNSLPASMDSIFLEQEPQLLELDEPSRLKPLPANADRLLHQLNDIGVLGLSARITEVSLMIQEVALALFEVQELRHSSGSNSDSARSSTSRHARDTSPSLPLSARASGSALTPVDKALMKLDNKAKATAAEVAQLEAVVRPHLSRDPGASPQLRLLEQKLSGVTDDWARVQRDSELLKDELKEDKWLVVFRTVSAQAEEMMESLEKVLGVSQEFVRDVHSRCRWSTGQTSVHGSPARGKTRLSIDSHGSAVVGCDAIEAEELLKSYMALQKNFHAKNKHYVPSCERVLGILAKGISSRSTKNGEVLRRYSDMKSRFFSIQERISRLGAELIGVEKSIRAALEAGPPNQSGSPSHLNSALLLPPPGQSPSSGSHKTRRALSSMTNYLTPTSPLFLARQSGQTVHSMSPLRKLASKLTNSHTRSVSSHPSSAASGQASAYAELAYQETAPAPPRDLRSIESSLYLTNVTTGRPQGPSLRASPPQALRHQRSSSAFGDATLHRTPSCNTRARLPDSRGTTSGVGDRPRWNISLKRIEDSPGPLSLSAPVARRRTSGVVPAQVSSSRSHSRLGAPTFNRPTSAAGRSEASCATTFSMAGYRSRPPSRHSRIPAPMWDPAMSRGRSSVDYEELIRPSSRCTTTRRQGPTMRSASLSTSHGLFSPTESDIARLPRLSLSHDTRRVMRPSCGARLETVEDEGPNPYDPLDVKVHAMCGEQKAQVIVRRIDPPLSRHPEKARVAGAGIGDQARYCFWFIGKGRESEEKSVMCKLVECRRKKVSGGGGGGGGTGGVKLQREGSEGDGSKVVVRYRGGWMDLENYLIDQP